MCKRIKKKQQPKVDTVNEIYSEGLHGIIGQQG